MEGDREEDGDGEGDGDVEGDGDEEGYVEMGRRRQMREWWEGDKEIYRRMKDRYSCVLILFPGFFSVCRQTNYNPMLIQGYLFYGR